MDEQKTQRKLDRKKSEEKQPDEKCLEKDVNLKEQFKRLAADFENYRKRTEMEKEENSSMGEERLVQDLLPIVDEFEKALEHEKSPDFANGVRMVHANLSRVLSKHGLEKMESTGKHFDSTIHEAAGSVKVEDEKQDGKILEEVRSGYAFNGRLIRHPLVMVGKIAIVKKGEEKQ
ncbi:MAG: nucleotide exchange factor GrpE [Candidatus Micrarchaeia archaeon]